MVLLVSFFVMVSSCGKGDDTPPENPNTDEPTPGNPDDPDSGVNEDPILDTDRNENKDQDADDLYVKVDYYELSNYIRSCEDLDIYMLN